MIQSDLCAISFDNTCIFILQYTTKSQCRGGRAAGIGDGDSVSGVLTEAGVGKKSEEWINDALYGLHFTKMGNFQSCNFITKFEPDHHHVAIVSDQPLRNLISTMHEHTYYICLRSLQTMELFHKTFRRTSSFNRIWWLQYLDDWCPFCLINTIFKWVVRPLCLKSGCSPSYGWGLGLGGNKR